MSVRQLLPPKNRLFTKRQQEFFRIARMSVLLACLLFPTGAFAAWSTDTEFNTPVSIATGNQEAPLSISDGAGGTIIIWQDDRNLATRGLDIYAQRMNAVGVAQWATNGVAIAAPAGTSNQTQPAIISDGAGGAIIVWQDERSGTTVDIYAQRISALGAVQWAANGVAIASGAGDQKTPAIVADAAGGAIISWQDDRNTVTSGIDIYAQRIDGTGAAVAGWTANGVVISAPAGTSNQTAPVIASDGASGAVIVWEDNRTAANGIDLYAMHVLDVGTLDAAWTADGVVIVNATGTQSNPAVISDGTGVAGAPGGAIIGWEDQAPAGGTDIAATRIDATGATVAGWPAIIVNATGNQTGVRMVPDGVNGAFFTWQDERGGIFLNPPTNSIIDTDIYAIRISGTGAAVAGWAANGNVVSAFTTGIAPNQVYYRQNTPVITADGLGGVIISWGDERSNNMDIYAQRLSGTGTAKWRANGTPISTASGQQALPTIVNDGAGGGVIAWLDGRSDTLDPATNLSTNTDIFAQHVAASFPTTTASPAGGRYATGTQNITLTCTPVAGTTCTNTYYTVNGTTPTTASPLYATPIPVSATTTLKFFSVDSAGGTELVNTELYTINIAPVATNGTMTMNEDADPAVPDPGTTGTLVASDANADKLSLRIGTQPLHGQVEITDTVTGAFNYKPNPNYAGADSFTFIANDGLADSNIATVNITVNPINDAPAADPASFNIAPGATLNKTLTASDPDADPLTFIQVTAPASGTLTLNAANGSFSYSNTAQGTFSFTYKANDGILDSNIATVTLTVGNTPPVATDQIISTLVRPLPSTPGNLLATDADGNALTYTIVSAPAKATVTITNPATGAFSLQATGAARGVDSFTFKVNDGFVDSNIARVDFSVGGFAGTTEPDTGPFLLNFESLGNGLWPAGATPKSNILLRSFTYTAPSNTITSEGQLPGLDLGGNLPRVTANSWTPGLGGIVTILGKKFGVGIIATVGVRMHRNETTRLTGGAVDIKLPMQTQLTSPPAKSFALGDVINIPTTKVPQTAGTGMNIAEPQPDMDFSVAISMPYRIFATACFLNCATQDFLNGELGPTPWLSMLHMQAPGWAQLIQQAGSVTGLGPLNTAADFLTKHGLAVFLEQISPLALSGITPGPLLPFDITLADALLGGLTGMSGTLDLPSIESYAQTYNPVTGLLNATGSDDGGFIAGGNGYVQVGIDLLGWALKAVGIETNVFNMNLTFYGIGFAYNIFAIDDAMKFQNHTRSANFTGTPAVTLDFSGQLLPFKVNGAGGIVQQGTASTVTLDLGNSVDLTLPTTLTQAFKTTMTYAVPNDTVHNSFTQTTADAISDNVSFTALAFSVSVPSFTIVPRICFPKVCVFGACTPSFCTPAVRFGGLNASAGPLVNLPFFSPLSVPVSVIDDPAASSQTPRPLPFNTFPRGSFVIEPELPSLRITAEVSNVRTVFTGFAPMQAITYTFDLENTGNVTLSSVNFLDNLKTAFPGMSVTVSRVCSLGLTQDLLFNGSVSLLDPANIPPPANTHLASLLSLPEGQRAIMAMEIFLRPAADALILPPFQNAVSFTSQTPLGRPFSGNGIFPPVNLNAGGFQNGVWMGTLYKQMAGLCGIPNRGGIGAILTKNAVNFITGDEIILTASAKSTPLNPNTFVYVWMTEKKPDGTLLYKHPGNIWNTTPGPWVSRYRLRDITGVVHRHIFTSNELPGIYTYRIYATDLPVERRLLQEASTTVSFTP